MISLFYIIAILILIYFAYPLWLNFVCLKTKQCENKLEDVLGISVVLLCYNGEKDIQTKIHTLLKELEQFETAELIIIDDHSTDGSITILEKFSKNEKVRLFLKPEHKGIPHTMNLAISVAKHEIVIFSDQRQHILPNVLNKLVKAIMQEDVGAVSACISSSSKDLCGSIIRRHENYLKYCESKTGNLIGVYGPLYAIKKSLFSPIPENIILDDLFLSLKILRTKNIRFLNECLIVDDSIRELYNYKRAKRYLTGFIQILKNKEVISDLCLKQKTMLFCHKYLRLLFPVLFFVAYVLCGILAISDNVFLIIFILLTFLILFSLLPFFSGILTGLRNFFRINIFYLIALPHILISRLYKSEITLPQDERS